MQAKHIATSLGNKLKIKKDIKKEFISSGGHVKQPS